MAYRAVFFDFDGVLTTDRSGSFTTKSHISRETGLSYERLSSAFDVSNDDLLLGKRTYPEIWSQICASLGTELDIAVLERAYASTPMNEPMFTLAKALKANYLTGIITDNKKDRVDYLKRYRKLAVFFDPIVVSAEVGAMKSGRAIFDDALRISGLRPEEAIFIDNTESNLLAPKSLGMATILFDDGANEVELLKRTLKTEFGLSF